MESLLYASPLRLLIGLVLLLSATLLVKLWSRRMHRRTTQRHQERLRGMHGEWQD